MEIEDIIQEIITETKADCDECKLVEICNSYRLRIVHDMCAVSYLIDRLAASEEKVKQLSEALKGYYEHSKNNHQINGLNETAKELLNNKEI
jgi:abortive infection bacteriophage resistance protein